MEPAANSSKCILKVRKDPASAVCLGSLEGVGALDGRQHPLGSVYVNMLEFQSLPNEGVHFLLPFIIILTPKREIQRNTDCDLLKKKKEKKRKEKKKKLI